MTAAASWFRHRWMTQENILFVWHSGLALVLVWWAFILAWPKSTFALSHAYDRFAAITPDETFWAVGYGFASLAGGLGCWAAWPSRAARHGWRMAAVRMVSAMLMAAVHGLTAIFMFGGADVGTGSGVYVLIMCGAYLLLRAEYERS